MNSLFLVRIGLGSFDLGYLFIAAAVLAVIMLAVIILLIVQIRKVNGLKKRLDKFLVGKDGMSLEQDIIGLCEDNKFLKNSTDRNKKDIRNLYKQMETAYQKMGLVKYDAFNQMGGQLLSIPFTARKDVTLIPKRLRMVSAPFLWETKRRKRWQ